QRPGMTPEPSYTSSVDDERGGVERVLGAVDAIRGLGGGVLVLVIAVASFTAGGTAGWALGGCLLVLHAVFARDWLGLRAERSRFYAALASASDDELLTTWRDVTESERRTHLAVLRRSMARRRRE